jgi:c-di-GMP-binding flagellar brake protein YcgR
MLINRRRHKRFSATAFLNKPVRVAPLLPYFAEPINGRLIDLSAGGMSIFIEMRIPQGTTIHLEATFPDHSKIECDAQVIHAIPRNGSILHGFEFLNLSVPLGERIERMSMDYIDCETRIESKKTEVCRSDCAFFSLCTKSEKVSPVLDSKGILELSFTSISKPQVEQATHAGF